MKLIDYLNLRQEKPYQFARRAGIGFGLVYALIKGEDRNLEIKTIRKILDATDKAVTFEDLA